MKYKLYAVRIFCFDWARCRDFYNQTLELPECYVNDEIGWAQFDLQGTYLGLERCEKHDAQSKDLVGRFVGISIQVDNIHQEYKRLRERGVACLGRPEKQPWGGSLLHFQDPDDNVLTFLGE